MAIGDKYQVVLEGRFKDRKVVVTSQYETLLSIGNKQLEMDSLLNAFEDNWLSQQVTDDLLNFANVDVTFTKVSCFDLINGEFGAEKTFTTPYVGELTGEALANDQCMLILKSTGLRGRSRRGRNYLPIGGEEVMNDGLWGPAFAQDVLDWLNAATKQITWVLNFSFNMIVWSEKYQYSNPVTGFSYITEPRRQKRRRIVKG